MTATSRVPANNPSGTPSVPVPHGVPARLLALLDRLGQVLAARGDAVALLGLGSVGAQLNRLDEHSDADFFVIVDEGHVRRYLDDLDWLEQTARIAWSFANTHDGRKVLFDGGLFAEYAVFTVAELRGIGYHAGRVVWARDDSPDDLLEARMPLPQAPTVEHQTGEAVTNLLIGLHRDLRGEHLAATRLVQGHAVDRLVTVLDLLGVGQEGQRDPFAVERRVEARLGPDLLPLAELVPGYANNGSAALRILELLERHTCVDPTIAGHIRELAARFGTDDA